ncbi:MAG: hypothetical protein ACLGPL_04850 [Acidobacteriota bacterium]
MVKLRVIKGGKSGGESCVTRLYSAYSIVDNYQGRDGVRFNWIYLDRKRPVAPYEGLIQNYGGVEPRVRPFFETYINELFTAEEVERLGRFVTEHLGGHFEANEEPVPAPSLFLPMPFQQAPVGVGRGFYYLSDIESYDLPFKVCGFFDVRSCAPSVVMQRDARERAVVFLEKALRILNFGSERDRLEAAVEAIYDNYGLHVEQGKTREERIKQRDSRQRPTDAPGSEG